MAPVQRWNAQSVYVQCPFCTKVHKHDLGGSYESIRRGPHCNLDSSISFLEYSFAYPFSERDGTVAYEIEKASGYFVALGAEGSKSEVEPLDKAFQGLNLNVRRSSHCKSWYEAREMIKIHTEDDIWAQKRLELVVSEMIFGDYDYVQEYLRVSPEAQLFLCGVNKKGESALSIAACERHAAVVKLLLDRGANPDHQDERGRTPLMEAALWGRIENVNHLLDHGANRKLRDNEGRQAADLAALSQRNGEERHARARRVYPENTFEADRARRVIVELLKDPRESLDRPIPTGDQAFESHSFRYTDRGTVELIAPVVEFSVQNQWKTVASLERPRGFPPMAAISGWSHAGTQVTVSGREWTDEVMRISSTVGHRLEEDEYRDQGIEGQYFATHAEKQLVA